MTTRAIAYGTLAVWTACVVGMTTYVLPDAADEAIGTVKAGLVVWGSGVAVLGVYLAWHNRGFFPE